MTISVQFLVAQKVALMINGMFEVGAPGAKEILKIIPDIFIFPSLRLVCNFR